MFFAHVVRCASRVMLTTSVSKTRSYDLLNIDTGETLPYQKHDVLFVSYSGVTRSGRGGRVAHPWKVWGKFWMEEGKEERGKGEF